MRHQLQSDLLSKHRAEKASQLAGCYSNVEEIRKGEISDRLANGYGAGSEPIKFTKTGSEIKEKLPTIVSVLTNEKIVLLSSMAQLKTQIGCEPSDSYSSKKFNLLRYPYKMSEAPYDPMNHCYLDATDQNKWCAAYNEACWKLLDIEQDLEAITVMSANLEDAKKYDLSVGQLVALQFNS